MRQELLSLHPEANSAWLENMLDNFIANPDRSGMCPPHLTGGSVDVTLYELSSGQPLDMGSDFDETDEISYTSALESNDDETYRAAKLNRRILFHAMSAAGFTNLPTEWWHYDYGNANWAYFSSQSYAIYGAIDINL